METAAFLGVLGLGYMASKYSAKTQEGFTDSTATAAPGKDKTPPGKPTVPGLPRTPPSYDIQYQLPSGESYPMEPSPSSVKGRPVDYATRNDSFKPQPASSLPQQSDDMFQPVLQTRPDQWEDATQRDAFVSPLSGLSFKEGEFKHANMVPFYRGQVKQSMKDNVNNQTLDNYTGSGKAQYEKREQTPFFEPTKEPVGNPFGFESTTDFMESRIVESRTRSDERPVEPIRVGPGLNQGYTHLPSGGFQQQSGEDYMIERIPRTNDLRVATNPKLTYNTPVVKGSHFITTSGSAETVGEVRKYNPDRFYINANGERNFVTVGADIKPAIRSAQVLKTTTRPDTSKPYEGVASQAEGKATYTVGSSRTPLVKQMGSWGIRNADLTANFNSNTDAEQNDYGKSGVEILPNERFYTSERVHATNLAADKYEVELPLQDRAKATRQEETIQNPRSAGNFTALGNVAEKATLYDPNDPLRTTIKETTIDNDWLGMVGTGEAQKLTVYDPNDPLRTTVKETTVDNDWIGMAAPAEARKLTVHDPNDVTRTTIRETTEDNDWTGIAAIAEGAQKLTVYDPDDIARVTGRNTLSDWDRYRNFSLQDTPGKAETRIQDGVRPTQKAAISAKSAYSGVAFAETARAEKDRTDAYAMRHYAQKETIARGRKPAGSSTKVFNGEDYVNLQYRRVVSDSVNDREPGQDRVNNEPTTTDVIGLQRPRAVLKLDITSTRNEPLTVSSLESNPYVIALHKVAAAGGKYSI